MLDADLARLYGVTTKRLNEQVKRNRKRFPEDFAFQLTRAEFANLKSQFSTSSRQRLDSHVDYLNRSQIATGSQKHRADYCDVVLKFTPDVILRSTKDPSFLRACHTEPQSVTLKGPQGDSLL
jgi:hypothetical protein